MSRPALDIKAIFNEALEIDAPEERAAYLDRACDGNPEARARVEALLTALGEAGGFLQPPSPPPEDATTALGDSAGSRVQPIADPTLDHAAEPEIDPTIHVARPISEGPGTQIGPYKLREKIGEGGMGVVYLAEQTEPVRRRVALKIIKPGMDTAQVVARFEAERQALAMMDHPSIAKVFDAGATDTGRPFFVMELVKGVPITEYCDTVHLTPKERLELFIPVCAAVQHAHQKGIIHRDIKPSNVLVAMQDGKPVPKVIDFGIAKATEQRLTERSLFTQHGAIVGTLEYMSPEQAEMSAMGVDTRTDVYALGVMLYELLTGTTPLERARLRESGYAEILKRIKEEEPPKPSTRLSESGASLASVAAQRKTEPAKLAKLVRGDLDWIVMKSLEKDRTRRYETANGFARDIQRYLDGDAVEACPPSARYRLGKFARKHRGAIATVGAFAALLVIATTVSVGLALWANRERVRALKAEVLAREQRTLAEERERVADRERARAVTAEASAKEQKGRAQEREQMAIDAVKRFGDVVRETPELKNNPALGKLRATLLKEPQAFFKTLRDRLQADRETSTDSLLRLARANFQLGLLSNEIGGRDDALAAFEGSLAIQERLAREAPSDFEIQHILAENCDNVGMVKDMMGRSAEALALHERAGEVLERLSRRAPTNTHIQDDLAKNRSILAVLLHQTGRTEEARASYEKSHAIRERLAREFPAVVSFQNDLAESHLTDGIFQSELGHQAKVRDSQERALAIYERMAKEDPSSLASQRNMVVCLHNIAIAQRASGQLTGALASMERTRAICERLTRESPSVIGNWSSLADCHYGLGVVQFELGRPAEALAAHERALAIYERLAREDPSAIEHRVHLARSYHTLGARQYDSNRPAEALGWYERALAIHERLVREAPKISNFQTDLAQNYFSIGILHDAAGRKAEALACYERALPIQERLANEHPESPECASGVGGTLNNLSTFDLDQRRFDEALVKLTKAIAWQRKALTVDPNNFQYRNHLTNQFVNLIRAYEGLGRADEAANARRELAELEASDPATLALDKRLADVLNGRAPKDDGERVRLANRASVHALHVSATRLFAAALEHDPKLGDDRQAQHRYNAACAAALAGAGRGKDDPPPDDAARAKLRGQALRWLRAELSAWKRVAMTVGSGNKETVAKTLAHWKEDVDLTGIRDETELAKLSEEERTEFKRLWDDVEGLLTKTAAGK